MRHGRQSVWCDVIDRDHLDLNADKSNANPYILDGQLALYQFDTFYGRWILAPIEDDFAAKFTKRPLCIWVAWVGANEN